MPSTRFIAGLIPLALAACGEYQPPTAPTGPGTTAEAAATAGLRVVTTLADPGDGVCTASHCTLREAIADAGSTEIRFAEGLSGSITLARPAAGGGGLVIGKSLKITGPSQGVVIRRLSSDPSFRILRVDTGATVRLANLTIRGAKPIGPEGAILNFGTLTLSNCKVFENQTSGINTHGPLTLANSAVAYNTGTGVLGKDEPITVRNGSIRANGGAGLSGRGTITVENTRISSNAQGGISARSAIVTVRHSVLADNGGTGFSQSRGRATLDHVRLSGNSTQSRGGGINVWNGELMLIASTVARNSALEGAGGIDNRTGSVTIVASAIVHNIGGGISSDAFGRAGVRLDLTNSTVSGNTGNGISNSDDVEAFADVSLLNTTVAFNTGYGVRQYGGNGADVWLTNSIVARNGSGTSPDTRIEGPRSSIGASFSLIGDGTGSGLTNTDGNLVGEVSPYSSAIDPLLGVLASNGGPTVNHALLTGSPAIDAGTLDSCPATDQRGVSRPQGAGCDMGSFEKE